MMLISIGVAALVAALWCVAAFNRFVSESHHVNEAWSGISVQLKRRHDLIPNLVETVKGYAAHEADLFAKIAQMRAEMVKTPLSGASQAIARSEDEMGALIGRIFAVSEAYPELRANDSFIRLHEALFDVEEQLQMARRYYNGSVREYMRMYESFPTLLIPKFFSFERKEYFELESAKEKMLPSINFSQPTGGGEL